MEAVYSAYFDSEWFNGLLVFGVGVFGFGFLLGVLGWMLGYIVQMVVGFFKV